MEITHIKKRNGELQEYDTKKIAEAVKKALIATGETEADRISEAVTSRVHENLHEYCTYAAAGDGTQCIDGQPTVEEIQDLVERSLMELGHYESAKAYILYRSKKDKERVRDLFKKRVAFKPYEYPELHEYVDAIRHSYWIHTEFNYTSDIQDFHVNTTPAERQAIKRAILAIGQIEVAVKTFWGDIYKKMPKPEIGSVGQTFAESEVRHADAYSHLLEVLGLNQEFEELVNVPVMKQRIEILDQIITLGRSNTNREYVESILLFALFVERVSLFSQFLIIMSFNKHKNMFKGVSNVVEATSKEEQIHGEFGAEIINIIREEHPEWFDKDMEELVKRVCSEAVESELKIIDWIFEEGECDIVPKALVKEFIKDRMNRSLKDIGFDPIFSVDAKLAEETEWFENEVIATKHVDFFQKRSINYNKRKQSITGDDLF
jgi:ribonucleoside-diphosphate reductase beta chain